MQMRVADSKGNPISATEQWRSIVGQDQWREGRSAHALADFILNRSGASLVESRISSVVSLPVRLEHGIPERAARFDRYRGPARLDIGISGQIGSGDSLFVGLEAKVDERFGSGTVCERYLDAIKYMERNPRSNAPARIRELLSEYFADTDEPCASRFSGVGYQLLTSAAGTVAFSADVSVFYVAVFRTLEFDEDRGKINQSDYENFVRLAHGERLKTDDEGCLTHALTLRGKPLVCIYEYFDVEN